jgi:SAM-dependent methyltransferase
VTGAGSASLGQPNHWWYVARADLLAAVLAPFLRTEAGPPRRVLDVGSADGPSVAWMRGEHERFTVDIDPRGLLPGTGVCGSATALPFADDSFDVVGAFDVIEHCASEEAAVSELVRVLVPGGRLLLAVPAYQWAWSDHDVRAGHHRRYTRRRLIRAVRAEGLVVARATYAFAGVFPLFAADRLLRRLRRASATGPSAQRLTQPPALVERLLLAVCRRESVVLRRRGLPFGSSVVLAATKPGAPTSP